MIRSILRKTFDRLQFNTQPNLTEIVKKEMAHEFAMNLLEKGYLKVCVLNDANKPNNHIMFQIETLLMYPSELNVINKKLQLIKGFLPTENKKHVDDLFKFLNSDSNEGKQTNVPM